MEWFGKGVVPLVGISLFRPEFPRQYWRQRHKPREKNQKNKNRK
jgi:hypothetical protein